MIDFGQINKPKTQVEVTQSAPTALVQEVTTTKVGTAESVYLLKQADQWGWEDLRDYVITEAENRFGAQIRNPAKEAAIFKSFIGRYGVKDAVLVAQASFEIYQGTWHSAPVTVNRFCKASDAYFADVILARVKG